MTNSFSRSSLIQIESGQVTPALAPPKSVPSLENSRCRSVALSRYCVVLWVPKRRVRKIVNVYTRAKPEGGALIFVQKTASTARHEIERDDRADLCLGIVCSTPFLFIRRHQPPRYI